MSSYIFDTRFFIEYFYTKNTEIQKIMKDLLMKSKRFIAVITIHEVYKLSFEKEGRETAKLRTTVMARDFKVINVDPKIAIEAAEIRSKYKIPMADSIIAATAKLLNLTVITDDEHFYKIKEIKTRWIR